MHARGKRGTGRASGVVVVGEVRRAGWGRMMGQGVTSSGVEARMHGGWHAARQ